MGRPKALLPTGASGLPFVRVICDTLPTAGVSPASSSRAPNYWARLAAVLPGVTLVVNPEPDRGQLSSLLLGLDALGARDAVLVTLVDLPRSGPHRRRVARHLASHARAAGPSRPRRPPRPSRDLRRAVVHALRSADVSLGAKPVIQKFLAEAVGVPVDDPGTVDDIDTPEAYERLKRP